MPRPAASDSGSVRCAPTFSVLAPLDPHTRFPRVVPARNSILRFASQSNTETRFLRRTSALSVTLRERTAVSSRCGERVEERARRNLATTPTIAMMTKTRSGRAGTPSPKSRAPSSCTGIDLPNFYDDARSGGITGVDSSVLSPTRYNGRRLTSSNTLARYSPRIPIMTS